MKYTILVTATTALLSFSTASAFMHPSRARFGTSLSLERSDATEAIKEALEASRMFGPQSKDARVSWDIVEEINASDNSIASKPACNSHAHVDENVLSRMKHNPHVLPAKVRAVKLGHPNLAHDDASHAIEDPVLKKAFANAELTTEWWGIKSKQAKLAWEAVEEILSRDNSEVMKRPLDYNEECLVDLMDACEGLAELDRALFGTKNIDSFQ